MPEASCVLCGKLTAKSQIVNAHSLKTMVQKKCIPTGFHYHTLTHAEFPVDAGVRLCELCMNWRKRTCQGRKVYSVPFSQHRKHREIYTPFDSVLMYALEPGHFSHPDQRVFPKLVDTVLEDTNAFRSLLPEPARQILSSARARRGMDPAHNIALDWVRVNEDSPFFRNPCSAKAIRRALLDEETVVQAGSEGAKPRRRHCWRK